MQLADIARGLKLGKAALVTSFNSQAEYVELSGRFPAEDLGRLGSPIHALGWDLCNKSCANVRPVDSQILLQQSRIHR